MDEIYAEIIAKLDDCTLKYEEKMIAFTLEEKRTHLDKIS